MADSPIPSYPKIFSFGQRVPVNPFDGAPAEFQEKVDGSQISFGVFDGILHVRSKGQAIDVDAPDKLFELGVACIRGHFEMGLLSEGLIYRGEYLNKPKHNTLRYGRPPIDSIVVFDVQEADPLGWKWYKGTTARRLAELAGFEYVPTWIETVEAPEELLAMLERESFLGGTSIEGVVLKRYDLIVPQFGSPLFCKYVSEAFKEVHQTDWKNRNPNGRDFGELLASTHRTEARWQKARQHLDEAGLLEHSPRDIGPLMVEVQRDIDEEEGEKIRDQLYAQWKRTAGRSLTRGLPEWYKAELLTEAFEASS